jgi:para-nitrobenzyl esterase
MRNGGALFATLALAAAQAQAAPVVVTGAGAVRGVFSGKARAFLGIPYAAPPVGTGRWREPQPQGHWQGVREAVRFAPSCYQAEAKPFGPYSAEFLASGPFSEDCLYLNIWTPAKASPKAKLPVLVFIHGGAFLGGSGAVPIYNGAALAARGATVITLNYRVNIFGFLAHPDLTAQSSIQTSGNYGLLDQIAALKWVKANVARFGGDPANITVSGESAGAASVNDLLVSPLAKGLFQKAISFSGASMAVEMPSRTAGEATGQAFADRLKLADSAALRAVPADKVLAAMNLPSDPPGPPVLRYVPHLDHVVVPGNPTDPAMPVANPVPLMTGFNAAEMIDPLVRTPADLERSLRARYGAFADLLLALYPHGDDAAAQAANVLIARDRYMSGLLLWGQARAKVQPVFLYLYDHAYPPLPGGVNYGAFHSSHLPMVFGNLGLGNRRFTPQDEAVSRQWQDAILSFLRDGRPATAAGPWLAIGRDEDRVNVVGDLPGPRPAVSSPARFEAFRGYAAAGGTLGLM